MSDFHPSVRTPLSWRPGTILVGHKTLHTKCYTIYNTESFHKLQLRLQKLDKIPLDQKNVNISMTNIFTYTHFPVPTLKIIKPKVMFLEFLFFTNVQLQVSAKWLG